ncbi:MAG TPA: hypothetical protein VJW96_01560 [Terriglobales bacterium]|jgi:hypothetical protein|nr:hypothetical protein [Terriglobales bacterium]
MELVHNSVRKIAAIAATMIIVLSASFVVAQSDAHKSFDLLKGMEGNWAGKNNQGQPVEVTFRMTAGGSALMSEIHGHGPENMITMFHMDGDRLLMTHYCGAGNQPRMKVISADAKSVSFEFFDGTNIGPGDGHMQHVTFTQPDADHHVEEWTFLDHGKEMKEVFTLARAK